MSFGENTMQPLEIPDARESAHKASELQRDLANELAAAHRARALAEFRYRRALSDRIKQLHTRGFEGGEHHDATEKGLAITVCQDVARGEAPIAELRNVRDEAEAEVARLEQEGYRMGADRRSLDGLIAWSMHRDLRTDTPPADWDRPGLRAAS